MAFKKVNDGYVASNPNGEMLVYHDLDVEINVGVEYVHADIVATNGQTVFDLTIAANEELIPATVVANFEGVNYTDDIAASDVTTYSGDSNRRTIAIAGFSSFPTLPNDDRHTGAILGIGSHVLRGVTAFSIASDQTLYIAFASQSARSHEQQAILDQIDGGFLTFGIEFAEYPATVVSVTGETTTSPQITLSPHAFAGEDVSFDFDEKVQKTHALATSVSGTAIPLIPGDELSFTANPPTTLGYVVVNDTPINTNSV